MDRVHPELMLPNCLVAQAIEAAENGDDAPIYALLETARNPYVRHPGAHALPGETRDGAAKAWLLHVIMQFVIDGS